MVFLGTPSAVFTTDYIDDPSTEPTAGPRPKIRRVTVTVTLPGDPDPNKVVRESANGGQDLANAVSDATRAGIGEGPMPGSGIGERGIELSQ